MTKRAAETRIHPENVSAHAEPASAAPSHGKPSGRARTNLITSLVSVLLIGGFLLTSFLRPDSASAMPNKTTTCLVSGCHVNVSTTATLAWGIIANGTNYPSNPTSVTVPAGSSFEVEWIATGMTDAAHNNAGMSFVIGLPTVTPTAWSISNGTTASSGLAGWNTVWSATGGWNWRTGTILNTSGIWPSSPNGYSIDWSSSPLWGVSSTGACYDNGSTTTPGDQDKVADSNGTDVVVNVPANTPAGTYTINIAGVGHYYTTKTNKGNKSQAITITVTAASGGDTTKPVITGFSATTPSLSRTIAVSGFTATDNTAVTGYMITTSSTAPLSTDAGWLASAPTSYTVGADGSFTLYPWAKDAAGNVSLVYGTPVAVLVDTVLPTVTSTVPANGATAVVLNSSVTLNFSENVDCTTVSTSSVTISPAVTWTRTSCSAAQAVFAPSGQANSTSYTVTVGTAVKDTAGNAMAASYPTSYTTAALAANNPPGTPSALAQYKSDAVTLLTKGLYTAQTTVVVKGTVTDPDSDTVKLDVELADVAAGFTGNPTCSSALVTSGSTAVTTCGGLPNGRFKWQARSTDSKGASSSWTQY
jgi:large repetitive protein